MCTWNSELPKLANVKKNAEYISLKFQKEVVDVLGNKVRDKIRQEVGDSKFCIILVEACDNPLKKLLVVILRFVDSGGIVRERLFEVVDVDDDFQAPALKDAISNVLARNDLSVGNMRGQGYDGASRLRLSWKGLQTSFLGDCQSAYHVHCFAHDVHAALVAASCEVLEFHCLFQTMLSIVSLVTAYSNCHSNQKFAADVEPAGLIAYVKLESRSLQRDTIANWSFHYGLITRLIDMFDATCTFLESMEPTTCQLNLHICKEAYGIITWMLTFDFVFSLLLSKEILEITEKLSRSATEIAAHLDWFRFGGDSFKYKVSSTEVTTRWLG